MAVIYLFDRKKQLMRPVTKVIELIHREGDYEAAAQIHAKDKPENGQYFGFADVDGRFRMFLITLIDSRDQNSTCTITGTDAALAELEGRIVKHVPLKNVTLGQAVDASLNGSGWTTGTVTADLSAQLYAEDKTYTSRWGCLKTAADYGKARVIPYYVFEDGAITARKVDVITKTKDFSGLMLTKRKGADNIIITEEGAPKGRIFGLGKIIADGEPPVHLTFADVEWSTANGDPADKPAGQEWVALPGAYTDDEYVFESRYEDDAARLLRDAFADLQAQQKPKASGTASLTDVEYLPGYEHRKARMWDRVVVRTQSGLTVESTVIDIDRYYVHKELTKLTIGDEKENNLASQIAKLKAETATASRGAGGARAGTQEVRVMTLEASERIELLSEEILLRATHTEVLRVEEEALVRHNAVVVDLDAVNARLDLTATSTDVDNLNNTVNELSAQLTIQAGQISTRVSRNGVISAINQTPETITINASRINLEGYVTADELSAQVARINNFFSGNAVATQIDTNILTCASAQITNPTLINYDAKWRTGVYVTGVTFPAYQEATIYYLNWNNEKVYQRVLTPVKTNAGGVSRGTTEYFLGRKIDE